MPVAHIPARELDITLTDHVRRIVMEIDNEQNRKRRRDAWVANQCLEGNQREYVEKRLSDLYPKSWDKFRIGDISIVKKINDKQAKSYKNQPIRLANTDKETQELNTIYKDFKFHRGLREFDSIYNLHKYACLWLTWQNPEERDEEEGAYILHALHPYEFDLVRDQVSGEPIVFIMNYPDITVTRHAGRSDGQEQTISESQSDTSAVTRVYRMWTKDSFVKVQIKKARGHGNESKELMSVVFEEVKDNPIGMLPIVYLQRDSAIDYPITSNIAKQSIDWNVSFSDLKTAAATQGHGQLVVKHAMGMKMKDMHMGQHTAITLPQPTKPDSPQTDANYINANPDLVGQLEVLKFDIANILDDQGVKAKGTIEGGPERFASGFDRLIAEADVQDVVEDNQSIYSQELEPGLFYVLKAYEEAMNKPTFSGTEDIEVYFQKPKVLISDKETLENIQKREELGLILPHEKHMIMNPNLSDEEAMRREEEIRAYQMKKMEEMGMLIGSEEDTDEEGEANAER